MQEKYLILALDFGSNSNKYCISLYQNGKIKILDKNWLVHKIKQNLNTKIYYQKLDKFIKIIPKKIDLYHKKYKFSNIISLAVGTEFYRQPISLKEEIIKINEEFLKKINTNFKIISQEEEAILSTKAIELFFKEYISMDMGGASTEITIKTQNLTKKFFYQFGCLQKTLSFGFVKDFIHFYVQNKSIYNLNKLNIILIGGSFIAILLSIKKNLKKILKKNLKNLDNKNIFYDLTLSQLENFYNKIINLNTNQIRKKYPSLKDREESVKNALNFTIYLLKTVNQIKVKISTLTLLEGLTLKLVELTTKEK